MKKLLMSTAIVAFGASNALAEGHEADECFDKGDLSYDECPAELAKVVEIEPAPLPDDAPDFTGIYIGLHAGYASASLDGLYDENNGGASGGDANEIIEFSEDEGGYALGGQFGFLYQFDNNIVIGAEIDASFTDIDLDLETDDGSDSVEADIEYMASARVRLGYAFDRFMPYATAGYGMISYEYSAEDPDGSNTSGTISDQAYGGAFGGGAEYLLTDYATIRLEGLYYAIDEDVDTSDITSDAASDDFFEIDGVWTGRVGLSFAL